MSSINTGRVVMGGLAAGVVIDIFELIFGMAFGEDLAQVSSSMGLTIDSGTLSSFAIIGLASGILLGLVLCSNPDAVRPRPSHRHPRCRLLLDPAPTDTLTWPC